MLNNVVVVFLFKGSILDNP